MENLGIGMAIGVAIGFVLGALTIEGEVSSKYNEQITICAANNFTYEKCAELYNWEIK